MCDPTVVAVGSAAVGYVADQQKSAAIAGVNRMRVENYRKQSILNRIAAEKAQNIQTRQLDEQERQVRERDYRELLDSNIRTLQAIGETEAGAASAGVEGASVRALLNDYRASEARFADSVRFNRDSRSRQLDVNRDMIAEQAFARANSMQVPEIAATNAPSPMGAALQAGVSGYGAYEAGKVDGVYSSPLTRFLGSSFGSSPEPSLVRPNRIGF